VPVGYLNDPGTKTIVRDPDRFDQVRQLFELALMGYSPRRIWRIAQNEWDFRTRRQRRIGGKHLALAAVYKMLNNPFYAGAIIWNGRQYPGAHEPIISWAEHARIQAQLKRLTKPRSKQRSFPFTGIIRCGECGYMVTAEDKTNKYGSRYTYYHCSKRRPDYACRQASVQAKDLEEQFTAFLERISLPNQILTWAKQVYEKTPQAPAATLNARRQFIEQAVERNNAALKTLTSIRLKDIIGDDEFVEERRKLDEAEFGYADELKRLSNQVSAFELFESLGMFRVKALKCFREGDDETKRLIFETVGSNSTLMNKKLSVQAKKPFRMVERPDDFLLLRGVVEEVRTLWLENDAGLIEIVNNIRAIETRCGIRFSDDRLHQH
jgi:hypothetical protein